MDQISSNLMWNLLEIIYVIRKFQKSSRAFNLD